MRKPIGRKPKRSAAPAKDNAITPADDAGVFFSSSTEPSTAAPAADDVAALSATPSATAPTDDDALQTLFESAGLWRANSLRAQQGDYLPTGLTALDQQLPGQGWPIAGLTELLSAQHGVGELRLLMPGLAQLAATRPGWIVWIAPPYLPNAPALMQWGIAPDRVLLIHPRSAPDVAWAAEQALVSGTCIAMLLWTPLLETVRARRAKRGERRVLSVSQLTRRLQLAAATHQCWAVALRDRAARRQPSAAMLRLLIESEQGRRHLHVLKARGGRPAVIRDFETGVDLDAMMAAAARGTAG